MQVAAGALPSVTVTQYPLDQLAWTQHDANALHVAQLRAPTSSSWCSDGLPVRTYVPLTRPEANNTSCADIRARLSKFSVEAALKPYHRKYKLMHVWSGVLT